MIVAIHQPEYLPWLGLLDKARRADVFVLLDDAQFNRASLQHRCKIAWPKAPFCYLTIPFVHRFPQDIRDVEVADPHWPARHRALIKTAYGDMPGYAAARPALDALFADPPSRVAEIATASMRLLFQAFGIAPRRVVTSTDLGAEGEKGDRVLDICQRLGAACYLSGKGGATYLDRAAFAAARVAIEVQDFTPPEGLAREVPGLSALDYWMRLGERAKEVFS